MSNFNYNSSKKKQSKDKAMVIHCKKRFFQRFGKELTNNMLESIVSQIVKRKSKYVGSQSCNRTIHIVRIDSMEVAVVYNKSKRLIHTCFPVEWITNGTYERYQEQRAYINRD